MARRKSSTFRKFMVLSVLLLAACGGYMLYQRYNKPVVQHTIKVVDTIEKLKRALAEIEE